MPELSAGVNCTFEDLAEMDGLVEGNRITCSSPAEKEVPRIIVEQGVKLCCHLPIKYKGKLGKITEYWHLLRQYEPD